MSLNPSIYKLGEALTFLTKAVARTRRASEQEAVALRRKCGWVGVSHRLNPGFLPSFPGVTVKLYCSKCYKKKHLKALKTFEGSFRF